MRKAFVSFALATLCVAPLCACGEAQPDQQKQQPAPTTPPSEQPVEPKKVVLPDSPPTVPQPPTCVLTHGSDVCTSVQKKHKKEKEQQTPAENPVPTPAPAPKVALA